MDHGDDEGKSELAEEAEAEGPFAEISRTDTELRSGRKNTSSGNKAIQTIAVILGQFFNDVFSRVDVTSWSPQKGIPSTST